MSEDDRTVEPVDAELLAGLALPEAYPEDLSASAGVEEVQTHISYVFLTGARVYKFRKAVDLTFLDFTRREEREADCLRELHLNRRLAPDVYLGVARAHRRGERVCVGPVAEHFDGDPSPESEPCVVMRRLPQGRDALSLMREGKLGGAQVQRMAERVAEFHASHRVELPEGYDAKTWLDRIASPARACLARLEAAPTEIVSKALLREVDGRVEEFLAEHAPAFETRRQAGHFVDGHGDLHLDHCWFEEDLAEPLFIDCIEFDEQLRHLDPASEVAFPYMDFAYRGQADLGENFLRSYLRASDDYSSLRVFDFYTTYRALVRSKVAAIAACSDELGDAQRRDAACSLERHLELARDLITRSSSPEIWLVSGIVGSGKSSAAEVVAGALKGVAISSDHVRKHLAGMQVRERAAAAWREGLYSEAMTERVYAGMLERALPVLESGRVAVLDATYARGVHRAAAHRFSRERGVPLQVVAVRCPEAETLRRLALREREDTDASDAGPELYAASRAGYEPWDGEPSGGLISIDTSDTDWRERLCRELRAG